VRAAGIRAVSIRVECTGGVVQDKGGYPARKRLAPSGVVAALASLIGLGQSPLMAKVDLSTLFAATLFSWLCFWPVGGCARGRPGCTLGRGLLLGNLGAVRLGLLPRKVPRVRPTGV